MSRKTRLQARAAAGPLLTAIVAGGAAGLVALLTFQAMHAVQRLLWETGAPPEGAGPVRIALTILTGGALLLILARFSPSETVDELLRDAEHPWQQSRRTIAVTALVAVVSVAFGGAIGPEAGLLAVAAQCSAVVSRLVGREEARSKEIARAGVAGTLGGLYGSPPAAAALDEEGLSAGNLNSFVAGVSGFCVFVVVARTVFGGEGVARVPLPESVPGADWLVIVPVLVGAAFGIGFRVLHEAANRLADWAPRRWIVTVVGTAAFAALAVALPLVRFSGHHELTVVPGLVDDGASVELWLLAVAKTAALVLCLVAGWRGGEIFPLVFIGAAAGAATATLIPGLDPAWAVAGAMAATTTVGWRRPLAAFLLLVLVVDQVAVLPLLAGVGVGMLVNGLVFPVPDKQSLAASKDDPDQASDDAE